jgi:membrane associated rhomboid family serine protease
MATQQAPDAGSGSGVPTCFRHAGRETYLSCTRCGRPACPECLRSAPVGQQCVECIKEGGRTVRRPTGVFGGRAVSGAAVTYAILALNVAFYLVEWAYPKIIDYLAMVGWFPDSALKQVVGVSQGQEYRLLTSAFLHEPGLSGFGPLHILFNMWALFLVGPALERLFGRIRFLALYLLSALGGSVFFYFTAPVSEVALGASGAIFGLFGAWFVVARKLRVDARSIVFLIAINLALPIFVGGIAWQAHVGGLITGLLVAAAYAYAPRRYQMPVQAGSTALIVLILVVAVLVRNHEVLTSTVLR